MTRKQLKLILILFSYLTIRYSESGDLVLDIVSKICPYTDLCHKNASAVYEGLEDVEPCCRQCSCEDNCTETENCCPDKINYNVKNTELDLICKSSMVRNEKRGVSSYLVADKCPSTEKDNSIRETCTRKVVKSLQDFIWVSDTVTGKIFQNKNCAVCHGVKNWRMWKIETNCREVLETNYDNLKEVIFSADCDIVNVAPDEQAVSADEFRCFIPDISVCNQTGLWQQYDAAIAEACQTYNVRVFEGSSISSVIYKNPFCYVCNKGSQYAVMTLCAPQTENRVSEISFGALFDFMETNNEDKSGYRCPTYEIYDEYMGRCRRLSCPPGRSPVNGKCLPLALKLNNLGIYVAFHLRISWDKSVIATEGHSPTLAYEDGEKILDTFSRFLGLQNYKVCSASLNLEKNIKANVAMADLIFWVCFILSDNHYHLDLMFGNIAKVNGQQFDVTLDHQRHLTLSCQIETRPFDVIISSNVSEHWVTLLSAVRCNTQIELRKIPCPEIELDYQEIMSLKNGQIQDSLISLFDDVDDLSDTTSVSICIADYLKLTSGEKVTSGVAEYFPSASVYGLNVILYACFGSFV